MEERALRAVLNPHRREILRLVWSRELASREIATHFAVSWPAVSQNLRVLREAGLVLERREGNRRLYRARRRGLGPVAAFLREMWRDDLGRPKRLVEAEVRRGPR
ncbi:MAG: metalloregulator ArsR/SmtB family transcription factor [Methanobacteriota archaeon]